MVLESCSWLYRPASEAMKSGPDIVVLHDIGYKVKGSRESYRMKGGRKRYDGGLSIEKVGVKFKDVRCRFAGSRLRVSYRL